MVGIGLYKKESFYFIYFAFDARENLSYHGCSTFFQPFTWKSCIRVVKENVLTN